MNVLIIDKLPPSAAEALRALGIQVDTRVDPPPDELHAALAEAHVLVVRSTKVPAAMLEAAPHLSLIVRAGAGVNTIDVEAASGRGVYVTNCPGRNKDAVAELTLGLLIACDRGITNATVDLRAGRWRKKHYGKAHGLKGRTLGLLGMGMVGQAVACRAAALGMDVVAWSPSLNPGRAAELGVRWGASPVDVARQSFALSVHLAYGPSTHHIVGDTLLGVMPEGGILINTSRGELVDTAALLRAIDGRGLRAGLDVFEGEPAGGEAPFAQTELAARVVATPHIGASTSQASEAVAAEVVNIIKTFRETGKPPNAVNLCVRTPATHALTVRHLNRVGVLAGVLTLLREEGINVEEMENTIFEGARAACCTLLLDQAPSGATLARLTAEPAVLQATLEARQTAIPRETEG